jgi:hypothetical protein
MEEHKSWLFEARVLRRTFRPNSEEMTGRKKIFRNEELKVYALLRILLQ